MEPSGTEGVDVVFYKLVKRQLRAHEDAHKAGVLFTVLTKGRDVGGKALHVEGGGDTVYQGVDSTVAVATLHYDRSAEGFAQRVEKGINKVVEISHRVGIGGIVNPMAVVTFVGSILLATLFLYAYDKPVRRWLNKKSPRTSF